jgi:hypothetical protein
MAIGHGHDLGSITALRLPDFGTPFFAGAKLPSMNASLTSTRPCAANPQPAPQIYPSEFPTAPIAEIVYCRFGTVGTDRVDRPTVHQSAAPRVSRRERPAEVSTDDHGGLSAETALGSMDLVQPIANR